MSLNSTKRTPCYFVGHGSPFIVLHQHSEAHKFLQRWGKKVEQEIKPKAIVIISAHWETDDMVKVGKFEGDTPLFFEELPEPLAKETYSAKGSPELADKIVALLTQANIKAMVDTERGYDHGAWAPLKIAIPEPKDLPAVQISLIRNASYEQHIRVGQALASLRNEGILFVGSGGMVHNFEEIMKYFDFAKLDFGGEVRPYNDPFDRDIVSYLTEFKGEERDQKLINLANHPLLRQAHITDEHLVPLHVIVGTGGQDPARRIFEEKLSAMSYSAIEFYES
ncbi:4518_t:CDS:2 [Ambispora gerdemannii]|uniref:4518_t:CDS:1 n=1 Tax=Ambispora gerdemannii TaxID=144530 RepID=A0A9N9HD19_9GLOM|nr:4518_t:CDS:2 [Ambispora gerdemannii]